MSQTPSVFSFNTGNDNTSLHPPRALPRRIDSRLFRHPQW